MGLGACNSADEDDPEHEVIAGHSSNCRAWMDNIRYTHCPLQHTNNVYIYPLNSIDNSGALAISRFTEILTCCDDDNETETASGG